jgi:hypothetical protein
MPERFDSYSVSPDDLSQDMGVRGHSIHRNAGFAGIPGRHTRDLWIAAAGVAEATHEIIGYIPLYASPLGVSSLIGTRKSSPPRLRFK